MSPLSRFLRRDLRTSSGAGSSARPRRLGRWPRRSSWSCSIPGCASTSWSDSAGSACGCSPAQVGRRRGQGRQTPPSSGHRRGAQGLEAIRPKPPEQAHGAIFCGKRGPYTARGIEYVLTELGRRANVPNVHPHRFRHDTGRRLVESVDLPTVAAWLGHERLDTVRIYSQPDKAALERAATCLEAR